MAFGFVTTTATLLSIEESHQIPEQEEIRSTDNINKSLDMKHKKAISLSKESALKVISISEMLGGISTSSGTYFQFNGGFYALTVAHGIVGSCENTAVIANELLYKCERIVELNSLVDYAIIKIPEIKEKKPIRIPDQLPKGHQWKESFSTMKSVYYTGYPNAIGPLTLQGNVAGYNENDFLYLQSYAWSGSSGAGIFTENGKLVAYVLALTIGRTEYGYNVSEGIVIAAPVFKVNWASILEQENENEKEKRPPTESKLPDSADSDSGFGYSNQ